MLVLAACATAAQGREAHDAEAIITVFGDCRKHGATRITVMDTHTAARVIDAVGKKGEGCPDVYLHAVADALVRAWRKGEP